MLNLNTLNPQQRQAVETLRGPLLILAGAGTGKTRVITCRVAYMIERGIKPDSILAVTFTNKAAREMRERVAQLVPRAALQDKQGRVQGPTICTFHSLCVRILRRHIEKLGYKRNFVIYDESEQLGAIRKVLSHLSVRGEKADPKVLQTLISRLKNHGARAEVIAEEGLRAMTTTVLKRYESALRACNAVDFDDLLLLALRLLREHPEVLQECRATYRYVMVDEYQDTNAAQFELVKLLTSEHRNLCVVGDDDQSIYGWRGAEIANLLDLEKHFPEVKVIKLEQNYRSTNVILNAANAVIKHNARRRGKRLWSDNGQGSLIRLFSFENEEEEARTVVEEIECARMTRRIPWSEHAILFRTNLQSRPFEIALRQAGVRYRLIGGQSYFDRREVRDFLAYLKVFLNPHDDVSLLRIANVPARGLSDVTMERLLAASQERHCSVYAAMRHTDVQAGFVERTRQSIRDFLALIETQRALLQQSESLSLTAWAERWLDEIGYINDLRRAEKNPETAENRVRNLRDLVADLNDGAATVSAPVERLSNFLEELALDQEREEDETESALDAVTLITMHSCKGLEFPHVFVVGIEDGLLPHARSAAENTLDEERRLFYVAITRAMRTLTLSHCQGRKKYGQIMPCHPSRFLKELPKELVEDASESSKAPVPVAQGRKMLASLMDSLK